MNGIYILKDLYYHKIENHFLISLNNLKYNLIKHIIHHKIQFNGIEMLIKLMVKINNNNKKQMDFILKEKDLHAMLVFQYIFKHILKNINYIKH